uniref:Uncharacterized protein n=1 Tax=Anguilla anguilla TaxID=7936 RepID=A0A0E9TV67_ANGAN
MQLDIVQTGLVRSGLWEFFLQVTMKGRTRGDDERRTEESPKLTVSEIRSA